MTNLAVSTTSFRLCMALFASIRPTSAMPLHVTEPARHITQITIDNQSKRNAMSRDMMRELGALWDELDGSDCRVVDALVQVKGFLRRRGYWRG